MTDETSPQSPAVSTRAAEASDAARRTTKKKDAAPRGIFRHRSGVWAARFTCGAGHVHQERVGPLKSDAVRVYHERRARALGEPGWCPAVERRGARARARLEADRERRRVTFGQYSEQYLAWARSYHRSFKTTRGEVRRLVGRLGEKALDSVTTPDIEEVLAGLRGGDRAVGAATVNRYRDRLSGMFKRAVRLELVARNPVTGIPKHRETGGRLALLGSDDEAALHDALPAALRPAFTAALHLGFRWSEHAALEWRDADLLTGIVTVARSKNGQSRQVPMNSVVRAALLDLATMRGRPADPTERVFPAVPYRTAHRAFERAVRTAQASLSASGKDTSRLEGFTWHGLRHTWASRLVMAGVDLRTLAELGGWKTLAMVQRYAHLAPDHLRAAVERLVTGPAVPAAGAVELRRNLDDAATVGSEGRRGVS